jgi:uncharacterized protein
MRYEEQALIFSCGDARLIGIVSWPDVPSQRGVLVVVGGPQYRAGSHRQFTLLCRALAERGITAMRFDYRGMGDSEGEARTFEDAVPDIHAAIDAFCTQFRELREIAIWGLCDAASAALFCAHEDERVTGLVLLNPWVRTAEGMAKTQLKHYYWSRLTNREFWRKVAHGEFAFVAGVRAFVGALVTALGAGQTNSGTDPAARSGQSVAAALPERMAEGLSRFRGKVLLILSGDDLTAQEFEQAARSSKQWRRLLADARVERRDLPSANHTFSRREWRDQVAAWTADWVRSW